MNQEILVTNPTRFAEAKIAELKGAQGVELNESLTSLVQSLDTIASTQPQLIIEVLDHLYRNRDAIPIQFYEELLSNRDTTVRLFRPNGVLGVVPFTRNLTEAVIDQVNKGKKSVLDVGCGCGLTSIAVAGHVDCVALDLSKLAVMTARLNAIWNGVGEYINFVHAEFSDYFSDRTFEILASNPPIDPLPAGSEEKAAQLYEELSRGGLDVSASTFAIDYYVDQEGRTLFDLILQRAPSLLKTDGVIVVANGNIDYNALDIFKTISERYGFQTSSVTWFANNYSGFRKGYTLEPLFGKDTIRKAVDDGIEVYSDSDLQQRITDPEKISGSNYYFRGFAATFKRNEQI